MKWKETEENIIYFVYGMINQAPEILSYLNLHRDFLYDIKRPIIILGSMYDIQRIATLAPDLWRFRSRTYDFSKEEKEHQPEYMSSPPAVSFQVLKVLSLFSWDREELKKRVDLNMFYKLRENDRKDLSELYEKLAHVCFLKRMLEKALEYCNRAIELDPENAIAYHSRGLYTPCQKSLMKL